MTKHRFSNSARTRQQVIELAGQTPRANREHFRGLDWLMGRRQLLVVHTDQQTTKAEALVRRYARMVLYQQEIIMRRLFWLGFVVSLVAGFVAGMVEASMLLVK